MRRIFLFPIVILCLLWIACDHTIIVEDPINVVKGTVIDSLTRVSVDSAWVDNDTLAPYRVYTDSLGSYSMPVGHTGKYLIYCGKDGYVIKNKEVIFTGNGITAVMNFELVPKGN